jgi:3-oxoacyl-[acyl-carrier protein] reductase
MENTGRIALVVGGSRGIGRAIALRLARSGFDIWLTCRQGTPEAEATVGEVRRIGRACELLLFDLADHDGARAVLSAQLEKATPYAVVFNSGVARDGLLVWMSREEWRSVMSVNLDGFHTVMSVVLLPMLHRREGRIVAITSLSGQVGQAGQVNYSASKAGLIGAVKALAREIGRKNILVNAVAPGVIETAMTAQLPREQILPLIPLQRYGTPEDVAAVVAFLCSEEAMYVHGQVIGVNGGMAT